MSRASNLSRITARLYLEALLPALEQWTQESAMGAELGEGVNAHVEFRALGLGKIVLRLGRNPRRRILLWLIGTRQFARFCSGCGWVIPLLPWGWWNVTALVALLRLCRTFESVLQPDPHTPLNEEEQHTLVRLMMPILARALPALAEDAAVEQELKHLPAGTLVTEVPALGIETWVSWSPDTWSLRAGTGRAPEPPRAWLTFHSPNTAAAAILNRLDTMTAINRGEISVRGLAPLADGLNPLWERLRFYLERKG